MSDALEILAKAYYRVAYADTDQMGFVYYGNYLTMFERSRNELMRSIGFTYKDMEALGFGLPVVEANVKYIMPAKYDDQLVIEARCTGCHGIRLRVDCRVLRDDELLAEGYTIHVFMDLKTGRPVRPCPQFLDKLEDAGKK